ncbi:MAG: pantothenate kinase, partial [Cyanobacteria bacterium P01_A01_bin.105]
SRSHWALFDHDTWQASWHTPCLLSDTIQTLTIDTLATLLPATVPGQPTEIWWASVVPQQAEQWRQVAIAHEVQCDRIPVQGLYPTLGIDRILALLGAGSTYKWPVLVIDAGTALTVTGGVRAHFAGGAILPGLQLQLQSLAQGTAALPTVDLPRQLPLRWATDTSPAIQSGILYTVLAGLQSYIADWWKHAPTSTVLFTGGNGAQLYDLMAELFQQETPDLVESGVRFDENLAFWGLRAYRNAATLEL